jgi:hypothetical protein
MAAESDILATLLEGASLQARSWVELGQRVQECCLALASESAGEMRKLPETAPQAPPQPERPPAKQAGKQAATV